jgi:hypothetical protein
MGLPMNWALDCVENSKPDPIRIDATSMNFFITAPTLKLSHRDLCNAPTTKVNWCSNNFPDHGILVVFIGSRQHPAPGTGR